MARRQPLPGFAAFVANLVVMVVWSALAAAVRGHVPESGVSERDYLPMAAAVDAELEGRRALVPAGRPSVTR